METKTNYPQAKLGQDMSRPRILRSTTLHMISKSIFIHNNWLKVLNLMKMKMRNYIC